MWPHVWCSHRSVTKTMAAAGGGGGIGRAVTTRHGWLQVAAVGTSLAMACAPPGPPRQAVAPRGDAGPGDRTARQAERGRGGYAARDDGAAGGGGRGDGVVVTVGGDCSFARAVSARAAAGGWAGLLGAAVEPLRAADLAIVNLESVLAPCLPGGTTTRPRLCADPSAIDALQAAGVDAVTLTNNHALDAGRGGLRATTRALAARGIVGIGGGVGEVGRVVVAPLGSITVVAANVTPAALPPLSEVALPSPEALATAVARAAGGHRQRPVLVLLHIGRELARFPAPYEGRYIRAAVSAGAAAVVLGGAHVRRARLVDHGVPVHLGLGNLVFDQHDPRARRGALLTLRLRAGQVAQVVAEDCVDSLTGAAVDCD